MQSSKINFRATTNFWLIKSWISRAQLVKSPTSCLLSESRSVQCRFCQKSEPNRTLARLRDVSHYQLLTAMFWLVKSWHSSATRNSVAIELCSDIFVQFINGRFISWPCLIVRIFSAFDDENSVELVPNKFDQIYVLFIEIEYSEK